MANITEFVCPCCGSSLKFNAGEQNLKCPYCDSEFTIDDVMATIEEKNADFLDQTNWDTSESQNTFNENELMNSYTCDCCGAEIICDENTTSTSCPYCGNNVLIKNRLSGALKPKYIIPFTKTEDDAKQAIRDYCKGKKLLPKCFKDENRINEVKQIYVPYWLFDADVEARIKYTGKKVRRWTSGDYEYEEEKFYSIVREGSISYEHLPIDASKSIENKFTESIEPFDFDGSKEFEMAYLAGIVSDKYDETADEASIRATERIKQGTQIAFKETITDSYNSINMDSCNIKLDNTKSEYALYPIYFLNTKWQGNDYKFIMNGQTGNCKGDLPMSKKAFAAWFIGLFFGIALIITLFGMLVNNFEEIAGSVLIGIVIGLIVAFATTFAFKKQLKGINYKIGSNDYYKRDSLNLTIKSDRFLYKKVYRRKRVTNNK